MWSERYLKRIKGGIETTGGTLILGISVYNHIFNDDKAAATLGFMIGGFLGINGALTIRRSQTPKGKIKGRPILETLYNLNKKFISFCAMPSNALEKIIHKYKN